MWKRLISSLPNTSIHVSMALTNLDLKVDEMSERIFGFSKALKKILKTSTQFFSPSFPLPFPLSTKKSEMEMIEGGGSLFWRCQTKSRHTIILSDTGAQWKDANRRSWKRGEHFYNSIRVFMICSERNWPQLSVINGKVVAEARS